MASQAIFGFIGVILGSLTTSVLTIYRERLATRHEFTIRDQQYERDRKAARDSFQRESILALQSAVFDVIKPPTTNWIGCSPSFGTRVSGPPGNGRLRQLPAGRRRC
jgi:hypothetical protein